MIIFQPARSSWLAVLSAEASVSVLTSSMNRVDADARTSLIATGVYSMPNWTRSPDPGGSANASVGGWQLDGSLPRTAVTGRAVTSGFTNRVIVASESR